jgi:hypothetical protein
MRLTVNRQNYKSINFYFKIGFRIEKCADFPIGNGFVMNDFVMVWRKPTRTDHSAALTPFEYCAYKNTLASKPSRWL